MLRNAQNWHASTRSGWIRLNVPNYSIEVQQMIKKILNECLNGIDPLDLTTIEARKVVADFYMRVEMLTFGQRRRNKVYDVCARVLESVGLGYFAA